MHGRYLIGKAAPSFSVVNLYFNLIPFLPTPINTYLTLIALQARIRLLFTAGNLYVLVGSMAPRKKKEKDEKESGDSGESFCALD